MPDVPWKPFFPKKKEHQGCLVDAQWKPFNRTYLPEWARGLSVLQRKIKPSNPIPLSTFSSISKLIIHENLWEVPMCQFNEFSFFLSQPFQVQAGIWTLSAKRVKEGLQVQLPSFLGTNAIGNVNVLVPISFNQFLRLELSQVFTKASDFPADVLNMRPRSTI